MAAFLVMEVLQLKTYYKLDPYDIIYSLSKAYSHLFVRLVVLCEEHWSSPSMIFSDGKQSPNAILYKCSNCGSYNKNIDKNWKDSCSQNYTSSYEASPYVGLPKGSHLNRIKDTINSLNLRLDDPNAHYNILDYGMGQGDFSKYILHYHPSFNVYGYDLFPQELENSHIKFQFQCHRSFDDLQNHSYDAISLVQAFNT